MRWGSISYCWGTISITVTIRRKIWKLRAEGLKSQLLYTCGGKAHRSVAQLLDFEALDAAMIIIMKCNLAYITPPKCQFVIADLQTNKYTRLMTYKEGYAERFRRDYGYICHLWKCLLQKLWRGSLRGVRWLGNGYSKNSQWKEWWC